MKDIFPESYILTPESEITSRLKAFKERIKNKVDAVIITWPSDMYYLAGTNQTGYLIIPQEKEPVFFVRRSLERAEAETCVAVKYLKSFRLLGEEIRAHLGKSIKKLGISTDVTPYRDVMAIAKALNSPELIDISNDILTLRSIKSPWELDIMATAGKMNEKLHSEIPGFFHPGITEHELSGLLMASSMARGDQGFMRTRRVNGEMYPFHVVAGRRALITSRVEAPFGGLGTSPSFPQGSSNEPIKPHEMILVDFGTCYLGYHVDVTRMFCWKKPPEEGLKAYEALKKIQSYLLELLLPGSEGSEIYNSILEYVESLGYGTEFLGQGRAAINFVAHGVGLDISEYPYVAKGRKEKIKENQTIALELKMVLPNIGSVGLENTAVITDTGGKILSTADENFIILED